MVKIDPATLRSFDRLGDEFLVRTLRAETDRRDNLCALVELGAVLTRLRRYEEGLTVDLRLVRMQPDEPIIHYNLACSLALLGRAGEAVEELERAVELGYDDVDHLLKDRDLRTLRSDPRFEEIVRRLRDTVAAGEPDPGTNLPD